MKPLETLSKYAFSMSEDGGAFAILGPKRQRLRIIASNGGGWDHVSISLKHRCPTWDEMCFVKNLFFAPDEMVIQYHPAKSDYVNCHRFCLHLWRPHLKEIPTPPSWMVGPVNGTLRVI